MSAKKASAPKTVRLNRYLAQCGLGSRRSAEELIKNGKVKINGKIVRELATQVGPDDRVQVDGRDQRPAEQLVYLAMNKPRGYDVTRADRHSHRRIYDLLPKETHLSVKAVGRLDRDSTGLLLLTNDGVLAHRLTHPSFGCPKAYQAEVEGKVSGETLKMMTEGVQLDDGAARAVEVVALERGTRTSMLRIVMHEGRKHIVRRLCATLGHPVLALERVGIGPLGVTGLGKGRVRPLTKGELIALRKSVGMERK
jgi:23S rRNA pseudouridine2605 synthase